MRAALSLMYKFVRRPLLSALGCPKMSIQGRTHAFVLTGQGFKAWDGLCCTVSTSRSLFHDFQKQGLSADHPGGEIGHAPPGQGWNFTEASPKHARFVAESGTQSQNSESSSGFREIDSGAARCCGVQPKKTRDHRLIIPVLLYPKFWNDYHTISARVLMPLLGNNEKARLLQSPLCSHRIVWRLGLCNKYDGTHMVPFASKVNSYTCAMLWFHDEMTFEHFQR